MKITWNNFKAVVDEALSEYYQTIDADNLSYRIKTVVNGETYECNVMKLPAGNADLVDYEANYKANAKTG